jgi:hypothetical protein
MTAGSSGTNEGRVEICEVTSDSIEGVSRRVNGYEYRLKDRAVPFLYGWCSCEKSDQTRRIAIPKVETASPILSNSAGQISGQCVNPKYTKFHLPIKSFSVKELPKCDIRSKGPPTDGRPIEHSSRSFSASLAWFVSCPSKC